MTQQYFFTTSIGPVQTFIATARTSQDLWFGSWMLSELAKAAAKTFNDSGHTLIFPSPDSDLNPGSEVNVANKVVAIVNDDPQVVARQVWDAIVARRNKLVKDSFEAVPDNFDQVEARKQLDDLPEFYWAAVPYDADKKDEAFQLARSRAESIIAARKNTRDFRQMHGKEGVPKSSLDGYRESVLWNEGDVEDSSGNLRIEKGESLSGIDLLKRWGKRQSDIHFVSTTDIAVRPFERGVGKSLYDALLTDLKALREKYHGKKETDGTHFYEDRMVQLLPDKNHAKDFRKEFANIFKKHGIKQRPSPYYALLKADGDNMGKMIDNQKYLQQHQDFSKALSTFADHARQIINQHDGVSIYVGGDDLLAYLPLHTALACAKALDDAFRKAMQHFTDESGNRATLSIGLAVAHHLTPLGQVVKQVDNAEKSSKQVEDKNGLAISLAKRGGAERVVKGKVMDLVERMEQLIAMMQKAVSHGAAYELEELQRRLNIPDVDPKMRNTMLRKEAVRILERKRESGGDENVNAETKKKFEHWLESEILTLDELAGEMIIAAELANAYELAKETKQ
jgi:CRISPR-associated protein Cmr2